MFDEMELALIEASRVQREALSDLGLTFAEAFPEEAESLSHFIAAHEAPRNIENNA